MDKGEPVMFEGIGDEELDDEWMGVSQDDWARGCAVTDSTLWLMLMAIVFVISWNLRRTRKTS